MLGDGPLASGLVRLLREQGYETWQALPAAAVAADEQQLPVDLNAPGVFEQVRERVRGQEQRPLGAVISLLSLAVQEDGVEAGANLCKQTLAAIQALAPALDTEGWLFNVTTLDGQFGLSSASGLPLAQASSLGLFKTADKEWSKLSVKNIDVDPEMPADEQQSRLLEEILGGELQLEVGLHPAGRFKPTGQWVDAADRPHADLSLDSESVVLVTGGAGGVTAAVAKELAFEYQPRLILVGRTPLPEAESEDLRACRDRADLRRHLIDQARASAQPMKPAEIEQQVRRIVKNREIQANIAAMEAQGAKVEYRSVDVRSAAFGELIDSIYEQYGRLDGVIHGAGIVEDKFIRDKTGESFDRVYTTKVQSARTLVEHLRHDALKFLVFFSSVSARFGSTGQCDYAAANEYLNKLACKLNTQWPGCVVAINWGPWEGGMVSEELKELFARRNTPLISFKSGARALIDELHLGHASAPEILIAAGQRKSLEALVGN